MATDTGIIEKWTEHSEVIRNRRNVPECPGDDRKALLQAVSKTRAYEVSQEQIRTRRIQEEFERQRDRDLAAIRKAVFGGPGSDVKLKDNSKDPLRENKPEETPGKRSIKIMKKG